MCFVWPQTKTCSPMIGGQKREGEKFPTTRHKRRELEFNLQLQQMGRAVPRTTPPLEADASNLRGSFRQTLRYSTTSESAAQGITDRWACSVYKPGGYYHNTRDPMGPPNSRITTRTRIGLLPRRSPWAGDSSTRNRTLRRPAS